MSAELRLLTAFVAAILLSVSGIWIHADGVRTGRFLERAAIAQQSERTRETNERAANQNNQRSEDASHAQARENQTLQDLDDRARAELDRLRKQLAVSQRAVPATAAKTGDADTQTLAALLGDCAREYQEVARRADGHALDAATLDVGWPTSAAANESAH